MDNLFQFIHPKQLFAPPQRQEKKLRKSRFISVNPPETASISSVDSADIAQTDGGIDLLETVQVPVSSIELINTLHVPQTHGGIDLLETVQVPVSTIELIDTLHVPQT